MDWPLRVHIWPTSKCNLDCVHCLTDSHAEGVDLPWDTLRKLLDSLCRVGVFRVVFGGGEPLLYPQILESVETCVAGGISAYISTNGTLITSDLAKALRAAGLEEIQVSLDSADPVTYGFIRGCSPAVHTSVLNGIAELKSTGLRVIAACVLMSANKNDLAELYELCSEIDVDILNVKSVAPVGRASAAMVLTRQDIAAARREVMEVSGDAGPHLAWEAEYLPWEESARHGTGVVGACGAGITEVTVAADGYIYPCSLLAHPTFAVGNLHESNFKAIWGDSPILHSLRNRSKSVMIGACVDCEAWTQCLGGCKALAWQMYGTLNREDPRCTVRADGGAS